ncbi:NAD-dependent epimerase/dehydratase family protein [Endozoicomonas acroporae]|uniref:NAD-dependent epimerase/dehydratase family protein n=1 Tax=Endozoicomonas acroporae TaxID=1701104 RepID=UPI000C7828DF|nr:NAD-dependent epimerase/dehydratase family protein [Endozoicomonas acroporae]
MMECNIIHQAFRAGVRQLLFLGSSCIYPKLARQPMVESELLNGLLNRLMDVSRLERLGWKALIPLHEGLSMTYQWFLKNGAELRSV